MRTAFVETLQPLLVRRTLQIGPREHLVAIQHRLFRVRAERLPTTAPLLELSAGEEIAFLAPMAGGLVAVGGLRRGDVRLVDPDVGQVGVFGGVPNTFDAVAIGNDLLVAANPHWPQGGANSGIWLLGPGRQAREVLSLVGPSAPLELLANGDLVVAELGPIVPPPPGAARLHRIPASRVAAAIAGATLSMADVQATGTGFSGLFDLAVDDRQRLHATDPASSVVVHTAPGALTPVGTSLDVGTGRFALTLQFLPHGTAPFHGYQPALEAPMLGVGTTDFASSYEWRQLHATRPRANIATGTTVAAGPFLVDVDDAPPLGLALAFASPPGAGPEVMVATIDGTPLWFGLPLATTFFVCSAPVAANGTASLPLHNPGGTSSLVDLQVVAIDPGNAGDLGSSTVLHLQLLP